MKKALVVVMVLMSLMVVASASVPAVAGPILPGGSWGED